MAIVLGVDLGTTKISALALDCSTGAVLASRSAVNDAETTTLADRTRGQCEWDCRRIASLACGCIRGVAEQLNERHKEITGLGITGQQHGVVLVDAALEPRSPLINWQDRRGEVCLADALKLVGADAPQRTGCRLAPGYMGVTLFWMKQHGVLPENLTACFVMDYFAALLTGRPPVTDSTCAASSGLLDLRAGQWDAESLDRLGLPRTLFPPVRISGERLGGLTAAMAEASGLLAGLPVHIGIGDNQASFVGSVGDPSDAVLVNIGTGGQVAVLSEQFHFNPMLETRPFPRGGYLLVSAGLSGGAAYAVLEYFFRQVAIQLLGSEPSGSLYEKMAELATRVPSGAEGLRLDPFFNGTRADPGLRGSLTGASVANFTPGHLTRALLEGMARALCGGSERMKRYMDRPRGRLIGAGNGLRENAVLAGIVSEAFGLTMLVPSHREEAAYGAALVAAVGGGVFADLRSAGRLIRYQERISSPAGG
jgi:sugar (pentulose or hexulose) kinase